MGAGGRAVASREGPARPTVGDPALIVSRHESRRSEPPESGETRETTLPGHTARTWLPAWLATRLDPASSRMAHEAVKLAYALVDRRLRPLRERHYILFPDLQLAYARVPKAGNSSVKHAMARSLIGIPELDYGLNQDRFWFDARVEGAELVTAGELFRKPSMPFVFTFVRNPFTRLLSCYVNKFLDRRELPAFWHRFGFRKDMTFPEFVRLVARIGDRYADNHFRSQADILTYRGRLVPHFVGRVEQMKTDWNELRGHLKRAHGTELGGLGHRVRSRQKLTLASAYRDPEIVELVHRRYRTDFDRFYPDAREPG